MTTTSDRDIVRSAEPVARRRLTASARRERVEAAAIEVFAHRGYDAASLGEIAAHAGVSRTVLYDHFPSKRELYLHVLETQNAAMLAEVGAGITGAGAGRDRMEATIAAYLAFSRDRPAARRLLVDPIPTGDAELDRMVQAFRAARSQAVGSMLASDLAVAGVTPASTENDVVVALLIAGIDGVARWWETHPDAALAEVTQIATRLLWQGLPRLGDR